MNGTPDPTEPVLLDLEALVRVLGDNDPELVREILEAYLETLTDQSDRLASAILDRDRAAVRAAAHAMKGASLTVAVIALGEICHRLEEAAPKLEWSRLDPMARSTLAAVAEMRGELAARNS